MVEKSPSRKGRVPQVAGLGLFLVSLAVVLGYLNSGEETQVVREAAKMPV